MNQENTEIASSEIKPAKLIVQDNSSISYLMDSAKFEHCYRIAKLMASASLIPDHLKFTGNAANKRALTTDEVTGNCFMLVNQAIRWGIDPFSMAPETYVVGGKLAFQGKLIAAVINGHANLEERLNYSFSGKPGSDDFTITVSGKIRGESEPRTVTVTVGLVKTDNQMWKKDPEQKLVYTGAVKWGRRHCPEIILGILIEEDIELMMRDVTPEPVKQQPTTANPHRREPAPAKEAAPEPAKKAASKPKAEPKQEPAPSSQRGTIVLFDSIESASGESKGQPWVKFKVKYTEDGETKEASTFSESLIAPLEHAGKGERMAIETQAASNPKYAPTLTYLEMLFDEPAQESSEGESDLWK